jgi:hypothetical protein
MNKFLILIFSILLSPNVFAFDLNSFFGNYKYKMYSCPSTAIENSPNQCQRQYVGEVEFKINTEKPQVSMIFNYGNNPSKHIMVLNDCNVIDVRNWTCGGVSTVKDYGYFSTTYVTEKTEMIDGIVNTYDGTEITTHYNNNSTTITYFPALKFKKE